MEQDKFEQYVQLITDKVYAALQSKEQADTQAGDCCREIVSPKGKRAVVSENDAKDMLSAGIKTLCCDQRTIITALARERLERAGICVVRK